MSWRHFLRNYGLAGVVFAFAAFATGCEGPTVGRSPTTHEESAPSGLAHDFVDAAGEQVLNEVDLELIYNLLERDTLSIAVEERLSASSRLEYRAPSQRSRWLARLARYFELAPLPPTYTTGEVVLSRNDVLFERTGVGGISMFGAVHDYDVKTEQLSLWGRQRAERGPDPGTNVSTHTHGTTPRVKALAEPRMLSTRLGRVSGDGRKRAIRDELLRLRINDPEVMAALQQVPVSSTRLDLEQQSWATSKVVRHVKSREVLVAQQLSFADGKLVVSRASSTPASSELYEANFASVSLISDVYQSLDAHEWRFSLGGGSGRARQGSAWKLTLAGVDHEAPLETTIAFIPLTFASEADAEAARSWFMSR